MNYLKYKNKCKHKPRVLATLSWQFRQYSGSCTDQIANLAETYILSSASMKKIAQPTPCVKPVY